MSSKPQQKLAADSEFERIREAYFHMVKEVHYRPGAPSDGHGCILLTEAQLKDPRVLEEEASRYATRFLKQEDRCEFNIGVSNWHTNRALVYVVEAGKFMCQDDSALPYGRKLLKLALKEVDDRLRVLAEADRS